MNLVFCGLLTIVILNCKSHKDPGWELIYSLLLDPDLSQLRASAFELIFYYFLLQCVLGIALRDPVIWTINALRGRLVGDKSVTPG